MDTYRVVMLGPKGAGKTVFLASLWRRLSMQRSDLGFYLNAVDPVTGNDNPANKAMLNRIYTEILTGDEFPAGNDYKLPEYCFECRVSTINGTSRKAFPVCRFIYLDYAGGRLSDPDVSDQEFEDKIKSAHVLLGLLDGEKLLAALRNESSATRWLSLELRGVLERMQGKDVPIHFVISKWDIVKPHFELGQIRNFLLGLDDFRSVVETSGSPRGPIRLIPVSALGFDFATLNEGIMRKVPGGQVKPYQVEMPLACVLPDIVEHAITRLAQQEAAMATNLARGGGEPVTFLSALRVGGSFLSRLIANTATVLDVNPAAVATVTRWLEQPQKDWQAQREENIKTQLSQVSDEKSAYSHAYQTFVQLSTELTRAYPASMLTGNGER